MGQPSDDACDLETSVADWVIEHPAVLGVMERLGIDYNCGGTSLEWACRRRGLDPAAVLQQFDEQLGIDRGPAAR
jgi:iron-sulfur cluster repair protein YtfE (RIC family)